MEFVCFAWISEQTANFAPHNIKILFFCNRCGECLLRGAHCVIITQITSVFKRLISCYFFLSCRWWEYVEKCEIEGSFVVVTEDSGFPQCDAAWLVWFRNVGNHSPKNIPSHPIIPESTKIHLTFVVKVAQNKLYLEESLMFMSCTHYSELKCSCWLGISRRLDALNLVVMEGRYNVLFLVRINVVIK